MGFFSKFEDKMEDTIDGAANKMSNSPISPVQIAKKAEKQMRREKMVGAGKEVAPTLYTVLVNPDDDRRLFGYYPTLAGETETYLKAKAAEEGLSMDGQPLVRFVVDDSLKHGKFDIIAETVSAPIIKQLRDEEMERYGMFQRQAQQVAAQQAAAQQPAYQPRPQQTQQPQPRPQQMQQPAAQPQRMQQAAPQAQRMQQPRPRQVIPQAESDDDYRYADAAYSEAAEANQFGEVEPLQQPARKPPLPYVPEDEIDYSIDYGEYTFNSEDFEDYRDNGSGGRHAGANNSQKVAAGQQRPNTVAFTGGSQGNAIPDRNAVQARLIDINYQRAYDLAGSRITIGRDSGNDIVVQDINASRNHAELKLSPQGVWFITDLRSTNGTVVNGVVVASQALNPGDIITIGKTDFEFTLR